MANLIAQELHASDDEADSFTKAPCWDGSRRKQHEMKHLVGAASSVADTVFGKLPVDGGKDMFEEEDEEYAVTNSYSVSGSVSEADMMEITNMEALIISILLVAFTNYNLSSLQIVYQGRLSLRRNTSRS